MTPPDNDWRQVLRKKFIDDAIKRAADALVSLDPEPDNPLSRTALLQMGGVPLLPDPSHERDRNKYAPRVVDFFNRLTLAMLARTGRYLEPVRSDGFRLLDKADSHGGVEKRTDRETELALAKGLRRMRKLPQHIEDPEERARVMASIASRGSILQTVRHQGDTFDPSDAAAVSAPTPSSFELLN